MPQITGMSPWLSMWSQPRSTIRAIIHNKPGYGVYYLASIFALQSFFFYANWWSLGLRAHLYSLSFVGILLSPLFGLLWLYFTGYIYHFTGSWLGGKAPSSYIRTAIAWSKIPLSINLLMWLILIFINPNFVFVQNAGGPSAVFVTLIALILNTWSFVLLVQSIREVQHFSMGRSLLNIVLASIISTTILLLTFMFIRYVYLIS